MARTNAEEWSKRVERWKDNGLTAKEFEAETGIKASTLSYWRWRLGAAKRKAAKPNAQRFLDDGRLPATNNISERQLRRQAIGRANWLFVGSDDGAEVNTTCASLVASCHMNGVEPESYLRDLLCLFPSWHKSRLVDLAPCNWHQTREQPDTQQRLAANLFRRAILELDSIHRQAS